MADLIPPMLIKLQADVTQLKAGLAQAENSLKGLDDSVKTASTGMTNFMGKMKQVGATIGVAFAGQQIVQFGKDVIMASSNMAESLSKVDVVFGQNAEAVKAWSETSATAMGMSKQSALEAAGTYGNLFQAFGLGQGPAKEMSTSLVQLASDMASFNNTSIDDAILALRSGLSGETEPLKKFGVALSEARLKNEALAMGLIKSTKEALTPAAKAQASYSLIMKDTILAQGDYSRTADGTANTMRTLKAEFDNAKVALGDALMPAFRGLLAILKLLLPVLQTIGAFFKKYSSDIMDLAKIVGIAGAAFLAYKGIMIATAVGTEVLAVAQALLKGQQLASIASTNGLAASMLALNAAMRANPIGMIVTGIALAIAAIVMLWKHSDSFRKLVITVGKAGLMAFASIIPMVGQVYEVIMKVVTGPLRALLAVLSHLPGVGKYAKAGLDLMNKGLDGISNFANAAAQKAKDLAANLDKVGTAADKAAVKTKVATTGGTGGSGGGGGGGGAGGANDKITKKLETYQKQVTKIYGDINSAVADAQEKADEALINRNEKMLDAHKAYDEKVLELQANYQETLLEADKNYNDTVVELQYRYNDTKEKANKRYNDTVYEAEKRYKERVLDIEKAYAEKKADLIKKNQETIEKAIKTYNDKIADLNLKYEDAINKATETAAKKKISIEKDYNDKILDLRKNLEKKLSSLQETASKKSADLIKSAADKQLGIVQQSMDRLRNAFASKTGFDLSEALAGGSPEQALNKLKKSLEAAKTLQANAAALAGMGYSQTFIEEIVKNGPEAGNKIAEGLKNASPEATKELMALYAEVENVSNHGLDALASTMNQGGKLATEELTNAYKSVSTDLTAALSEVQQTLNENLADANASYAEAMAEAKTNRDEKLAETESALLEALAIAKKALDDDIADALKTMNEAVLEANKTLSEGLAEAEKNRIEDLAKAKKDLDDSIADAKKALIDAMAEAQKDLDKGMADAQKALDEAREKAKKALDKALAESAKTLQDALIDAQKDYEKAIDEINKSTTKKLADLKQNLADIAADMAKLGTAEASKAAISAIVDAPGYNPIIPQGLPGGGATITTPTSSTTINITGINLSDPYDTSNTVVSAIKFGNIVVPSAPSALAAGESGAIGAASIAARTRVLNTNTSKGRVGR